MMFTLQTKLGLHYNINMVETRVAPRRVLRADYRDFIILVSCGFMLMLLLKINLKINVSSLKNQNAINLKA